MESKLMVSKWLNEAKQRERDRRLATGMSGRNREGKFGQVIRCSESGDVNSREEITLTALQLVMCMGQKFTRSEIGHINRTHTSQPLQLGEACIHALYSSGTSTMKYPKEYLHLPITLPRSNRAYTTLNLNGQGTSFLVDMCASRSAINSSLIYLTFQLLFMQ